MDEIRKTALMGRAVKCMVIDTHVHLLPKNGGSNYWSNDSGVEKAIAAMDRLGIDCCVATTTDLMGHCDLAVINGDMARIIDQWPGRVYGHIFVKPYDGLDVVKQQLELYSKNSGFVSIKFLTGYHGSILQTEYQYALDFALEAKCPVMFHNWGEKYHTTLDVVQVMKRRPELKLISAHMGGGVANKTREYAEIMKDYPNMKMDIAGSVLQSMTMEDLVDLAGPDRWLFGSDASLHDPSYDFGKIVLSPLDDGIKKMILSENYLNLLKDSSLGHIPFDNL